MTFLDLAKKFLLCCSTSFCLLTDGNPGLPGRNPCDKNNRATASMDPPMVTLNTASPLLPILCPGNGTTMDLDVSNQKISIMLLVTHLSLFINVASSRVTNSVPATSIWDGKV